MGRAGRAALGCGLTAFALVMGTCETQNAIANGDTRTITIYHTHTKEGATITFKRNGTYDRAALKELNWLLRDWRHDEPTNMDPKLFDVIWEVYRETGSREAVHVVSAYRSPTTNAMLRRRSRAVAEHSQHMLGKAMDFYLPDADMGRVRAIGLRLQRGGVGYYPSSYNPFVHLDVASVRAWPRPSYQLLAQIFPDGKTVHIPANGQPMPGYEQAKAEILARGGTVQGYTAYAAVDEPAPQKSFWARLFGGSDEDEDTREANRPAPLPRGARTAARSSQAQTQVASAPAGDDAGIRGFFGFGQSSGNREPPAPQAAARPSRQIERPAQQAEPEPAAAAAAAPAPAVPSAAPLPVARPAPAPEQPADPAETPVEIAAVPLPPRRPSDLPATETETATVAVAEANVPLPPVRPASLVQPAERSPLRQQDVTALAALSPAAGAGQGSAALAYAPLPAERPADVASAAPSGKPRTVAGPAPARIAFAHEGSTAFASDNAGQTLTAAALRLRGSADHGPTASIASLPGTSDKAGAAPAADANATSDQPKSATDKAEPAKPGKGKPGRTQSNARLAKSAPAAQKAAPGTNGGTTEASTEVLSLGALPQTPDAVIATTGPSRLPTGRFGSYSGSGTGGLGFR